MYKKWEKSTSIYLKSLWNACSVVQKNVGGESFVSYYVFVREGCDGWFCSYVLLSSVSEILCTTYKENTNLKILNLDGIKIKFDKQNLQFIAWI